LCARYPSCRVALKNPKSNHQKRVRFGELNGEVLCRVIHHVFFMSHRKRCSVYDFG
jgi:hypothetical protein